MVSDAEAVHTADNGTTEEDVPGVDKYLSGGDNAATGQQKVVAKLLISNPMAGCVIGKAGQTIEQLQRSSKARIQLSRAGEFYPGTSDRVLMLSGPLDCVLTALYLVLEKVSQDGRSDNGGKGKGAPSEEQVKLVLPRRLCGIIIGQKGQTVREFMNDSGATIRIQSLSDLSRDDSERVVTVQGSRDKVLRAAALVLNAISTDPKYASYMEATLELAASQGLVGPVRSALGKSPLSQTRTTVVLSLPDADVGAILGKAGQTLTNMQQAARVKITVSDRKAMDPGTKERQVTIAGTHSQVQLAEAMIAEKIAQHRAARGGSPRSRTDASQEYDQDNE